jgi:hypothetical protein
MTTSSGSNCIADAVPSILKDRDILVPLRIDLTAAGVRIVDTFCWNLYSSILTPDEFAASFVSDQGLPLNFHALISLQICEQLTAFEEIINCVRLAIARGLPPPWKDNLFKLRLGIRHHTIDYSDKFQWDVVSNSGITPEGELSILLQQSATLNLMLLASPHFTLQTLPEQLALIWDSLLKSKSPLLTRYARKYSVR